MVLSLVEVGVLNTPCDSTSAGTSPASAGGQYAQQHTTTAATRIVRFTAVPPSAPRTVRSRFVQLRGSPISASTTSDVNQCDAHLLAFCIYRGCWSIAHAWHVDKPFVTRRLSSRPARAAS